MRANASKRRGFVRVISAFDGHHFSKSASFCQSCWLQKREFSDFCVANFAQFRSPGARPQAGHPETAGGARAPKQRAPCARCAPGGQAAADRARTRGMARRRATAREHTAQRAARRARSEREQSEPGGHRAGGRKRRRAPKGEAARTPRSRESPRAGAHREGAEDAPRGPRAPAAEAERSSPRAEGAKPERRARGGPASPASGVTALCGRRCAPARRGTPPLCGGRGPRRQQRAPTNQRTISRFPPHQRGSARSARAAPKAHRRVSAAARRFFSSAARST